MRWHGTTQVGTLIALYFSNRSDSPTKQGFINSLKELHPDLDKRDLEKFRKLLTKYKSKNSTIHSTLVANTVEEDRAFKEAGFCYGEIINKLASDYLGGNLSTQQKETVDNFILFTSYPEHIPGQVDAFAEETVVAWQEVEAGDIDAVSKLCAESFYQFTKIHPFPNANGRTAMGLVNLMLKSLGYPDILMRLPGDKSSATSSYSKAIKCIESDRGPLCEHFKLCIVKAQENPYQDPNQKLLVIRKMEILPLLREIRAIKPDIKLADFPDRVVGRKYAREINQITDRVELEVAVCGFMVIELRALLSKLKNESTAAKASTSGMFKPVSAESYLSEIEDATNIQGWFEVKKPVHKVFIKVDDSEVAGKAREDIGRVVNCNVEVIQKGASYFIVCSEFQGLISQSKPDKPSLASM